MLIGISEPDDFTIRAPSIWREQNSNTVMNSCGESPRK